MKPWYHVAMVSPTRGFVILRWECRKHQLFCSQRDYPQQPRCPKCEGVEMDGRN